MMIPCNADRYLKLFLSQNMMYSKSLNMKLISILVTLSIFSLSFIESKPNSDVFDSNFFVNIDENVPLIISSHFSEETETDDDSMFINGHHHPKYPKYPKYPKHPKHPRFPRPRLSKRAYVRFTNPPELTAGVMVFWETKE